MNEKQVCCFTGHRNLPEWEKNSMRQKPVSYTHLDVYKRQLERWVTALDTPVTAFERTFLSQMNFIAVPSFFRFLKALTFYKLVIVVGAVELWKVCRRPCRCGKNEVCFPFLIAVENMLRQAP